jgi:HAE1 family hydrophobic/amphiphilic exporter-1
VDPDKLRAQQIGINEVDQALQNWNVNLPTGQLFGAHQTFNLKAGGQLNDAAEFRQIVVAYRQGRPVRLDQVATVLDSVENTRSAAWFYTREGGRRAINMGVQRQPGINIIEVTDAVRAVLPGLEAQLPPSAHLQIRQDRSKSIRKSFADIQWTMLITLALVVGVIYVFLHNGSATLIPGLALPFSILGTFAVMQILNFSMNNLSMMALILSIGFVVDDAIVMLENIVRHIENGEDRLTASLNGSKEIGFTILTMTTSLAAVFIPILFMSGILGRLFREFAVTITAAILISGVVSITLTPMLCSRFLRVVHTKTGLAGFLDRAFDRLFAGYKWSLGIVLRRRFAMVVVFLAVLGGTVYMYGVVPKGFIPDQDNDMLFVNLQAAQGTSFYDMSAGALRAAEIIRQNPNVDSFVMNLGGNNYNGGGGSSMQMPLQLLPRAERKLSAQQIAQQLRPQLLRFPNFRGFVRIPPALQIGFGQGNSSYNVTVQSADTDQLYAWAQRLSNVMERDVPEIQDVSNNLEIRSPKVNLVIDRDKAAAVGLNATQIENALSAGFGPKWSSTIYSATTQYRVLLELDPKYQEYADSLDKLTFKTPRGALVPLPAIVTTKETVGPQSINHSGQLPYDRVRRLGQSIPRVDEEPRPAALRRDRRRLHRARRALRELHPSDHDSLGPAVGRPRRADYAVGVRQRAEHLFVRRSRHAHRHREKERHHAD